MNDMTPVIQPKVDQLTADHLLGGPRTIRITQVTIRPGTEQPVSINYENDDGLPWRPCKSMSRVLVKAWGPDASKYAGRYVTLYRDDKVKWGGLEVGGLRVSHLSDIPRELVLALTEKKGSKKPFIVKPLVVKEAPQPQPAPVPVKAPVVDAPEFIWRTMDGKEVPFPVGTWAKALGKALASMQDAETIREWRSERGGLFASIHESGDAGAALIADAERAIDMRVAELESAA